MRITFSNLQGPEIGLIAVILIFVIALGNYGRNTALGYWGSILLTFLSTPLGAFIIIYILRARKS